MKVIAVIPARYASTRFPGKPLADLLGRPMLQWVWERSCQAERVDRVLVATDDRRIATVVEGFGGEVVMTRADHASGTDRLAEAVRGIEADLVVNVQGDEPLIDPAIIDAAIAPLLDDSSLAMGTLKTSLETVEDCLNPNVVKLVTDLEGRALYFSRSPIPHQRGAELDRAALAERPYFRHIGLYVYRRDFLLDFAAWDPTPLEQLEQLEQLRALEHGARIMTVTVESSAHGVDTPEDLERVAALVQK